MKILYIIHSCIMGGATISFTNLVKGVRVRGYEVVIVYPKEKDVSVIREFKNIGCKCYCVKRIPHSWFFCNGIKNKIKVPLNFIRLIVKKHIFMKELKKIIFLENPDIIHTNTGIVHEGFLVAKKLHIPHVWHLREYQLKDFNGNPYPSMKRFKKSLRESFTVCITKDIQKYFELNDFSNSFVIYNPIMSENFSLKLENKLQKYPYFFVANRISREKGIEDIINTFSEFWKEHSTYNLLICGFGSENYVNHLKKICREKQIEKNVDFLGYMESERIYRFMYNSKALIVASYYEGFGRMTAEANMLGIPVLGRNTAGTKEILEQTNGGFQFSNEKEMLKCMEKVSNMTKNELHKFMMLPQKKAIDLFSNEQHIKKMLDFYGNMTNSDGGVQV